MTPLTILIEPSPGPLCRDEIKYVFETMMTIAGFPWRYVSDSGKETVDIAYGSKNYDCSLSIKKNNQKYLGKRTKPQIIETKGTTFLSFSESSTRNIVIDNDGKLEIKSDIILAAYQMLSGYFELEMPRKKWGIHFLQSSFLFKNSLLEKPLINQWAGLIKQHFKHRKDYKQSWPGGKKYAVALSHDVDYPEIKKGIEFLRYIKTNKLRSKLSCLQNILAGKETFWKFQEWTQIENESNIKSAFYFCGFKGSLFRYLCIAPDPFYNISTKQFEKLFASLKEDGFEIGMHASFLSYQRLEWVKKEKQKIEKILRTKILGNRHHYWHLDHDKPYETAEIHHKAGLLYDTSMGFETHSGFRRGICSPYNLYHPEKKRAVDVLQLPPSLMDDHLFGYATLNRLPIWKDQIDTLLDSVRRNRGLFMVDFHVRVLNELFFPGWGDAYKYILALIANDKDAYIDTPVNIALHWKKREKILRRNSIDEIDSSY